MHKWSLGPSLNFDSSAPKQIVDHVLIACSIYQAPQRAQGLTSLDDETRYWLNTIIAPLQKFFTSHLSEQIALTNKEEVF